MENQVIKDQTLQGCHYVIIGFRVLKLLSGHIESLYFVAINARDVGKITQRTLLVISVIHRVRTNPEIKMVMPKGVGIDPGQTSSV